jgi:hypothetical protein
MREQAARHAISGSGKFGHGGVIVSNLRRGTLCLGRLLGRLAIPSSAPSIQDVHLAIARAAVDHGRLRKARGRRGSKPSFNSANPRDAPHRLTSNRLGIASDSMMTFGSL